MNLKKVCKFEKCSSILKKYYMNLIFFVNSTKVHEFEKIHEFEKSSRILKKFMKLKTTHELKKCS